MKRKALITATAVLLVAVMCLATASYAWFTAGTASTVANLNVSIKVDAAGLYIAPANVTGTAPTFECGTFTTNNITKDIGDVGFISSELTAVSTNGKFDNAGVLKFYEAPASTYDGKTWDAQVRNEDNFVDMEVDATQRENAGYNYFAFYVKSDAAGNYTLNIGGSAFSSDDDAKATLKLAYSLTDASLNTENKGEITGVPNNLKIYMAPGQAQNDATDYDPLIGTGADVVQYVDNKFVPTTDNEDKFDTSADLVEHVWANPTISFTEAGVKLVTVAIWVEGQDPQCTGTLEIPADTITISLANA